MPRLYILEGAAFVFGGGATREIGAILNFLL